MRSGYEGDTCNFTCNTGYELTGSNVRTCQSGGSWSDNDDVCRRGMPNKACYNYYYLIYYGNVSFCFMFI